MAEPGVQHDMTPRPKSRQPIKRLEIRTAQPVQSQAFIGMTKCGGSSSKSLSVAILAGTVVMLGVLLGCQSHTWAQRQSDIEQTIERFLVAFGNRDIPAFSAFLVEDATMFFPSAAGQPTNRVEGKAAIGQHFKELYERVGPRRDAGATIRPRELKIQQFDGFAVVTFHLGTEASRGRRTFVLRRSGSEWKIVHVHASQAN
jgi:ketosteroid isomerase-like protein